MKTVNALKEAKNDTFWSFLTLEGRKKDVSR